MSKVAIVTDSSPNIPENIIKENNIHVVPLTVIWGEENYYDGVDISPVEFYQRLETAKVMPSTSQPSVADFEILFRSLHNDGYEILAILISEDLSGTVSSATQAKKLLPDASIEIVNSKTLAMEFQMKKSSALLLVVLLLALSTWACLVSLQSLFNQTAGEIKDEVVTTISTVVLEGG